MGQATRTRILALCGVAILIGTLSFGSALAAGDSLTQQVAGGSRSVTVTGGSLSSLGYSHDAQISTGTLALAVDDSSGTGQGWNVTIEATDFSYSGQYAGEDIGRENLAITAAGQPGWSAGQAIDAANGPRVPGAGATGSLDQPRKVLHANVGYGQGSYTQTLDVALTMPGMTRAGSYSAVMIVTISAGP